jgi:hypothetical protein
VNLQVRDCVGQGMCRRGTVHCAGVVLCWCGIVKECAGEVCAGEGLSTLRTLQCVGESFCMRVQVTDYMQVLDCSEGPCR